MDSGTCNSCGAPIVWGVTVNGKTIPLDLDRVLGGNIRTQGQEVVTLSRLEVEEARESGELLYVTHFTSCPDAVQHRRRGPRKWPQEESPHGARR